MGNEQVKMEGIDRQMVKKVFNGFANLSGGRQAIIDQVKNLKTIDQLREHLSKNPDHIVECYDRAANKLSIEWLRVINEFNDVTNYLDRKVVKKKIRLDSSHKDAPAYEVLSVVVGSFSKTTLVNAAASEGWIDVIKFILEETRFGVNDRVIGSGWTMLQMAANNGRVDAVDLLLEYGANPNDKLNDDDMDAVALAVTGNHLGVIDRFYLKGVSFEGALNQRKAAIDAVVKLFDYDVLTDNQVLSLHYNRLPETADYGTSNYCFLFDLNKKLVDSRDEDPHRILRKFLEIASKKGCRSLINSCREYFFEQNKFYGKSRRLDEETIALLHSYSD